MSVWPELLIKWMRERGTRGRRRGSHPTHSAKDAEWMGHPVNGTAKTKG